MDTGNRKQKGVRGPLVTVESVRSEGDLGLVTERKVSESRGLRKRSSALNKEFIGSYY